MDLSKNKKRATRRKRNLIARDLIHNKEFRPKVFKPKAEEDNEWLDELEEYYAERNEGRRPVREAKEGGTLSGVSSEDSSVSDRAELEDRKEIQEQKEEEIKCSVHHALDSGDGATGVKTKE